MLAKLLAVLAQAELLWCVHCVLGGVINTFARFFANETDNLTLFAFFSHKLLLVTFIMINLVNSNRYETKCKLFS